MESKTIEITCHTSSLLGEAGEEIKVLAVPFKIIDTRLQELNKLVVESGTDRMKKIMELLGYFPE